jgi:hypothetical protein
MWVKTTCCNSSLSFLKLETSVYNVLVQSFTSTQAATCRELQLSLVFQLSWKGATTPFALALAKILVRRFWPTEGYNLLFLPGTNFSSIFRLDPQSSRINQSPFHQLDLKQVDIPLTAVHRKLYQKPYSRNRTQNPAAISRNSQITT